MRYHYEKPDLAVPVYGEVIELTEHPFYKFGTLYLKDNRGIVVVQQHFSRHSEELNTKYCYWGAVDPDIANDIYLSPYFHKFFMTFAKEKDYPIFQLRKIMWSLRMKPLKRDAWEDYFGAGSTASQKSK